MVVERIRQMTVEEYFAFDEASEYKNEYIDGEVVPMTGGTVNHDSLIVNTIVALWQRLSRSGCQVHAGHVRHSVSPTRYLYPDVSVVCGAPETDERSLNLFNPLLVAEVTSPSSMDYDRGSKLRYYQSIKSLQVILVIDQYEALVEVCARGASGWQTHSYTGLDAVIPLAALGCDLPLAEIYRGISF
ncbi:MAG: Uma2 family endonuclease [Chloroflexota bacterium]|nr:Uma2 family endonuclease [Chloroflexota bacterium]MDE2949682.1 Uma2 family endonuclease [Chloroflexota bacterium]